MDNNSAKNKIAHLVHAYKLTAILSVLSAVKNDYNAVLTQYDILKQIWNDILEIVKNSYSETEYKKCSDFDIDNLTDELKQIKTVDLYNKILSLKYLDMVFDDVQKKIIIDKICLELNPFEEIIHINLAKNLYKSKNYTEAIELCDYIKSSSQSAPAWEISADSQRALKNYGQAISDYQKYIEINDGDYEVVDKLNETYKEALNYG